MKKVLSILLLTFVLISTIILANSTGQSGRTLRDSNSGCGNSGCHGVRDTGNIYITPTITLNGEEFFDVIRDSTYILTLNINNIAGGIGMKGFDISTRYGRLDTVGGQIFQGTKKINDYELVHNYPNNITNSVLFKYTAPSTLVIDTIFATVNRGNPAYGHISRWNFMPNKPIIVNDPLPIKLEYFTSVLINNTVKLNWKTADEINNSGFEIYRNNFKIGFVKGKNYGSLYNYTDNNLLSGTYYYKIRQIDYNGNYEEFEPNINPIEIKAPNKIDFTIYPNPFNSVTRLRYTLKRAAVLKINIYNINGKLIKRIYDGYKSEGYYEHSINDEEMSSGVYILKIQIEDFNKSVKLVVLK